jgi:hypothetical protein
LSQTALIACLASGCAAQGDFPSLMPRAGEMQQQASNPDPTPLVAAPDIRASDPALAQRLTELMAQARQGEQAYAAELAGTRAAIAGAGAPESENWIEAQLALSRLEAARNATVAALSDLDALAVSRDEAGIITSASDHAAIAAASTEIGEIASAQEAELARLSGLLRGG